MAEAAIEYPTDGVIPPAAGLSKKPAQVPEHLPRTARAALTAFFNHTSPRTLILLVVVTLVPRLALGGWRWADGLVALAVLAYWPINEWLIHVYVLHARPRPRFGRWRDSGVAKSHRAHHANPWDPDWVFIPLYVYPRSIPQLLVVSALLTWNLRLMFTFLSVYMLLSLHYEFVHYLAHIGWCPKLSYYQRRVREHRLHHFRNDNYWWGVSMGLGDRLLRTAPDPTRIARSGTTATLEVPR